MDVNYLPIMQDITVIILTLNEEIHIERCITKLGNLAKKIYVIDCFSKDNTVSIAEKCGATVIQHKWEGNHARQLNWAIDNIKIETKWVLRLDADEYLSDELINEIENKLPLLADNISAIVLPLKRVFMGRIIKHGVNDVAMIRLFKYGYVRCEERWMDEHMTISEGESTTFINPFVDDNVNTLGFFTDKHNNYSIREAITMLDNEIGLISNDVHKNDKSTFSKETLEKRKKKDKYARMPLFWRSFFYFCFRYFLRGGFLDGKEGFLWHFLQGWWYRTLVDAKILEIKKNCGTDKDKIKEYIKYHYNIEL